MSFQSETTTVASNEQAPLLPKTQPNDIYNNDNDDTYLIKQPRKYKAVALLCAVFLAGSVFWIQRWLDLIWFSSFHIVGSHFAAHTLGAMKNIIKEVDIYASDCNLFYSLWQYVGFWHIEFPVWCYPIQRLYCEYCASCFWWYCSWQLWHSFWFYCYYYPDYCWQCAGGFLNRQQEFTYHDYRACLVWHWQWHCSHCSRNNSQPVVQRT